MGTDIHMIVQHKVGDEWIDTPVPGYSGRNYLFGMLADVRNGSGFAGVDLGDGFVPLRIAWGFDDALAGLPEGVGEEHNDHWLGDHSYSVLSLTEALGPHGYYDRTTKHRGWISLDGYARWKEGGGSSPGPRVIHLSNEDADTLLANPPFDPTFSYYTKIEWEETYRESADTEWFDFLEECRGLDSDPDNVRLVFGFDS